MNKVLINSLAKQCESLKRQSDKAAYTEERVPIEAAMNDDKREHLKKYILLTGSKKNGLVWGKRRTFADDLYTFDTLEEARKEQIVSKRKWPHMLYWIVEIDFDLEERGVEP